MKTLDIFAAEELVNPVAGPVHCGLHLQLIVLSGKLEPGQAFLVYERVT